MAARRIAALANAVREWPNASFHVLNCGELETLNPYTAIHIAAPPHRSATRCHRERPGSRSLNSAINIPNAIGSRRVKVLYSIVSTGAEEKASHARHPLANTSNPIAIAAIILLEALRSASGHAR